MAGGNNLAHGKGSISTKAIENIRPNVTGSKSYLLIYFYLKLKIERPGKKKKTKTSSFRFNVQIIFEALQKGFFLSSC